MTANQNEGHAAGSPSGARKRDRALLTRCAVLAIATATIGATPVLAQQAPQTDAGDIVVTATKRETTLQTTSMAISVVGANDIATRHLGGADDYLQGLPGVSYQDRGAGSNSITIRGIGQGDQLGTNSPVGTYFGETPINGLGAEINGNQAGNADLKLVDIKQVEVLRGPQGTLYGSGTLGGTVRVMPNDPNLTKVEGSASAEYSNTARFGGNNYKVQAVINAPLVQDVLAVRAVAYRFRDDGYVKNIAATVAGRDPTSNLAVTQGLVPGLAVRDEDHSGTHITTGFRGAVLFKPTERLTLKLMYAHQEDKNIGLVSTDLGLGGPYLQARAGVGVNGQDRENVNQTLNLTNAIVQYDLGFGQVMNSTSFIATAGKSDIELTFYPGPLFGGEDTPNTNHHDVFINETRFSSAFKGPFQVLGGVYYENRRTDTRANIAYQYSTPIPAGDYGYEQVIGYSTQKQLAVFGEASLKLFNDKLTLTAGGRWFKFDIAIPIDFVSDAGGTQPDQGTKASITGTNWKGSIAYEFSKSLYVYGLFSEGFRAPVVQQPINYAAYGDGTNDHLIVLTNGLKIDPPAGLLAPDKTKNYEVGVKFKMLDGAIRGSLTGYWIDWSGIPLVPGLTINGGAAYYLNAGLARSKGIEFETTVRLPWQTVFTGAASYTDSVLAETQAGLGTKGTPLPGTPKWNAHAALQKNFHIVEHDAYIRADYTYVGSYYVDLLKTPPAAGNYGLVDLSAGITIRKIDFGVFAKNIFNSEKATWYDNVFTGRSYLLRPRTIGVRAGINF